MRDQRGLMGTLRCDSRCGLSLQPSPALPLEWRGQNQACASSLHHVASKAQATGWHKEQELQREVQGQKCPSRATSQPQLLSRTLDSRNTVLHSNSTCQLRGLCPCSCAVSSKNGAQQSTRVLRAGQLRGLPSSLRTSCPCCLS
jgi:hypothetical protein